jgi:hypothetical protein
MNPQKINEVLLAIFTKAYYKNTKLNTKITVYAIFLSFLPYVEIKITKQNFSVN